MKVGRTVLQSHPSPADPAQRLAWREGLAISQCWTSIHSSGVAQPVPAETPSATPPCLGRVGCLGRESTCVLFV